MNNYNTALELMDLARHLGPEGEGIDVNDLDLELEDLIEIKSITAQMRTAGEVVNRALAQYWNDNYEGRSQEYGEDLYFLGYAAKRVFQPGQDIEFARWVKEQEPEVIVKLFAAYNIKVSPLGGPGSPLREQFFDEEKTSDDLRIQSKPTR